FPSSQRRGGCAEGADGVVGSAERFRRTDHPGAASFEASPYRARASRPARRGIAAKHAANLLRLVDPGPLAPPHLPVRHCLIWISCVLSRFNFQLRLEPGSTLVWQYGFAMGFRPQRVSVGCPGGKAGYPLRAIDRFGTCCCCMPHVRKDASAVAAV